jgi:hypothetical protein
MNDLLINLCNIRREQVETPYLLPPSEVRPCVTKAEAREKQLREARPAPDSDEYTELDCIICNLDELQQRRADLIWSLAYDSAGDLSLMMTHEAAIYQQLITLAQELRGEAS